jgi:hypothetical protein
VAARAAFGCPSILRSLPHQEGGLEGFKCRSEGLLRRANKVNRNLMATEHPDYFWVISERLAEVGVARSSGNYSE